MMYQAKEKTRDTQNFDVGYLGAEFDYFSKGFVHKPDQNKIKADQDRTRRALSNALFTFSLALLQTGEKPQILQKNHEKNHIFLQKSSAIRPQSRPKPINCNHR